MGDVDQPDPDDDQQAGQRGQRNPLDRAAEEQREQRHPHAVQDGGRPRLRPGRDVGGTAHDHTGHGQPAGETRQDIGRPLREEFTVEVDPARRPTTGDGQFLHRYRGQQ